MRITLGIAAFAVTFCAKVFAAEIPAESMSVALAREVVNRTVELVESRGLYPRQQAEYNQAKAALLAAFDSQPAEIDRMELYARIRTLLATLDTNGHTFLIPTGRQFTVQRKQTAPDDLPPPTFQLLKTRYGTVLRWTPPPVVGSMSTIAPYLKRFYDEVAALPNSSHACALVVDLSEQSGGNAWPPFVAMYPLFGKTNTANWVDRDGKRTPVVDRVKLEAMHWNYGGGRVNPLSRFDSGPLAVVASKRTSSAGEMLLIALLGETRVQTFGSTSSGMTTANATYPLPDGSTLVLTESRYALGDGPVYRGGVRPIHQINPEETFINGVTSAAEWAATNSLRCSTAAPEVTATGKTF